MRTEDKLISFIKEEIEAISAEVKSLCDLEKQFIEEKLNQINLPILS